MLASGRDFSHIIGNLFLAITVVSAFNCLIRTDYNFVFAILSYYLWESKRDPEMQRLLMFFNLALIAFDIIWLVSLGGLWTTSLPGNALWNGFKGLHVFVLILSVIGIALKLGVSGAIYVNRKSGDSMSSGMIRSDNF